MRSSESDGCLALLVWPLFIAGSLLLAACSTPPVASQTTSTARALECAIAGPGLSPQEAQTVDVLRGTVEKGPLYAIANSAAGGPASCRIGADSSGIALEYTFRDGAWLRVMHDPRIEYDNQDVRFASPLAEDAVTVLTRVEQTAFAPGGCDIDWRKAETQQAGDDPGSTETIYRGDTCNCQARVRKDIAGRVVGLVFRSAC